MAIVNLLPTPVGNFSDYNFTQDQYVETMLGPKHLSIRIVLPVTFVYVAIFITGVFGNFATCLVIVRNPVMQTATNYYLFSLAVSDLTLLLLGKCRHDHPCQFVSKNFGTFPLPSFKVHWITWWVARCKGIRSFWGSTHWVISLEWW